MASKKLQDLSLDVNKIVRSPREQEIENRKEDKETADEHG